MGLFDLPFGKKRRELQQQKQEIDKAWAKLKEFTADNEYARQVLSQIALHNGVPAFSYDLAKFINTGYVRNPNVFNVANKIIQPAKDVPWLVYEVKDKVAFKRYKAFKDAGREVEAFKYGQKALELVEGTPLNKIFEDKANELQSWSEVVEQSVGFFLLAGNDFLYEFTPVGFKHPTQIYVLPATAVEIIPGPWQQPVKGYKIVLNRDNVRHFEPDTIIHRKTFNPTFEFGVRPEDYLYGLSPLSPLYRTTQGSNENIDAQLALFLNGGPPGIFTQDTSGTEGNPMKASEREDIQKQWRETYGGGKKAGIPAFTGIKLSYVTTGMSPVDLQLLESDDAALKKTAGVLNVPLPIVLMDAATLDNYKVAEKQLYVKAIIPALSHLRDAFNKSTVAKVNKATNKEYWVDFDLKGIPVLQEDKKEKSAMHIAEMEHGVITGEEYRALMDMEKIEDPDLKRRMLKSGLRFTDEPLPSNQQTNSNPPKDDTEEETAA